MPHSDPTAARSWRRRWYAALPDSRKAQMQAKANQRATALRRYLDEVKLVSGCVDCGYRAHPAALDFDHVTGEKRLLVSFRESRAQADAEIAKCEVRCANCHRIKTWERRWGSAYPCKPDIFDATYEPADGNATP